MKREMRRMRRGLRQVDEKIPSVSTASAFIRRFIERQVHID